MLAPTASDCAPDGELRVMIGDIELDATLTLLGDPVTFVAYTTLVVRMAINQTPDGISLDFAEVELVDTELTADDASIELEPLLKTTLESQLVDGLLGQLGGFGEIALPAIDLSGLLGLPAGSAELTIAVSGTTRDDGTTIISAELQ
jgi:hypothetical protein